MSAADAELTYRVEEFDSAFLDGPVWRLCVPEDATPDTVCRFVDRASDAGVRLLFSRQREDSPAIASLRMAGFRQVETLVTYEAAVPSPPVACPPPVGHARPEDLDACAMIGRGAFTWDRYHRDPAVPRSVGDQVKEQWVRNAFAGRADHVLVARTATGIVGGFLLLLHREAVGIVDLIAVAPDCRGQGLGKALLEGALATLAGRATTLRAGTQETNESSAAMYRSAGFQPMTRQLTFHWTPGTAADPGREPPIPVGNSIPGLDRVG